MSVELYDKEGEKNYALIGINKKLEELSQKTEVYLNNDFWYYQEYPTIKEKMAGIGEMAKRLKEYIRANEKTIKVIEGCHLDHMLGTYLAYLASKDKYQSYQFHREAHNIIGALNKQTTEFFKYLSVMMGNIDYLDFILTHTEVNEEEQRREDASRKHREEERIKREEEDKKARLDREREGERKREEEKKEDKKIAA
jgi:hypothetical protein